MDGWIDRWICGFSSVTKCPKFTEGRRMQMTSFCSNNELSEILFFSLNLLLSLSPYSLLPKRFGNITTNTNLTTNNDLSTNNALIIMPSLLIMTSLIIPSILMMTSLLIMSSLLLILSLLTVFLC